MGTVTREGDGDNLVIDNENTRLIGINTDESNAVRKERNTESGKDASDFLHTIAPVGTEVESTSHGRGAFGRRLSGVKLLANGDKVDAGLVILDNAFSAYTTDRGIHPDPEQHDIYKEYFSDAVPFNYADKRPRLSNEEMESTAASIKAFQDTKIAFSEGTASRDELDTAMANAYGENNKVAAYRYQLRDWDRAFDISKMDGSDRMAFEWANQSQANKDKYDSAMR